jgi:hypothetical protein
MIKKQLLTIHSKPAAGPQSFINVSVHFLTKNLCHTNMAKVKQVSIEN